MQDLALGEAEEEEHNILACKIKHAALGPNPSKFQPLKKSLSNPHLGVGTKACQSLTCVRRLRVASGSRMKPLSFATKKIMALLKSRALAAWQQVGSKTSELAVLNDLSSAWVRFSSLRGGVRFDQGNPGISISIGPSSSMDQKRHAQQLARRLVGYQNRHKQKQSRRS